jgi:hypothetical protein
MNEIGRSFSNPFTAPIFIENNQRLSIICKIVWQIARLCRFGGPSLGCWAKRGFVSFDPYISDRSRLKHMGKNSEKLNVVMNWQSRILFTRILWIGGDSRDYFTSYTLYWNFSRVWWFHIAQFLCQKFDLMWLIYGTSARSTVVRDRPGLSYIIIFLKFTCAPKKSEKWIGPSPDCGTVWLPKIYRLITKKRSISTRTIRRSLETLFYLRNTFRHGRK